MTVEGTPVFNAITLLEIEGIDYRGGAPSLVAKAAFVNTRKDSPGYGKTHGQTTCRIWSKETLRKLDEFKKAIELDMGRQHFEEEMGSHGPTNTPAVPDGISEHLGPSESDARSI